MGNPCNPSMGSGMDKVPPGYVSWADTAQRMGRCPFGQELFLGVTLPNDDHPAMYGMEKLTYAWIFYSYVPWICCLVILGKYVYKRGVFDLLLSAFAVFVISINQLLFLFSPGTPRPGALNRGRAHEHFAVNGGSCVGQWSGISTTMTYGFALYIILVVFYASFVGYKTSRAEYVLNVLIWTCILLPVPLARIMLRDFTAGQALMACAWGFSLALFFLIILQVLSHKLKDIADSEISWRGFTLVNVNLPPPFMSAVDTIEPYEHENLLTEEYVGEYEEADSAVVEPLSGSDGKYETTNAQNESSSKKS